jgi:hypothetical protein
MQVGGEQDLGAPFKTPDEGDKGHRYSYDE